MAIAKVRRKPVADAGAQARAAAYVLEDQVGFLLRCAHQRATEDFNATMGRFAVTPVLELSEVALVDREPDAGVASCVVADNAGRSIARLVVADDQLEVGVALCENALDRLRDVPLAVVCREKNADPG